jgi:hypothetical protein
MLENIEFQDINNNPYWIDVLKENMQIKLRLISLKIQYFRSTEIYHMSLKNKINHMQSFELVHIRSNDVKIIEKSMKNNEKRKKSETKKQEKL